MATETVPPKNMLGNQVYGPFEDWEMVPTPYGTWGLPAGQRMWIEMLEIWDPKEQRNVSQPWPVYEVVEDFVVPTAPLDPGRYRTVREQRESEDSRAVAALEKIAARLGTLDKEEDDG